MSQEVYTQLCSEKTLQTNKEGFFLQFANVVAENAGEKWVKNVFGKLNSDKDRIRRVYQDDKIKDYVIEFLSNVQEIYRKKCAQTSRKRKLEAETAFKNGNNLQSLALFSQSVLKSPRGDETLSLALLGRSKVLMFLNEYSNALTDIQLCLKENLPDALKSEAFLRMCLCYKALGDENKAKISFNVAKKMSGNNVKILDSLNTTLKNFQVIKQKTKTLPQINGQTVAELKSASKKIKVKTSSEAGRYVVANEEIKTGETLVIEEPHASCLYPEKFGTHCHHCFERLLSPVGCPDCSSVAFCKPECRDLAIRTYHKYECKFLDLLIGSGMSVLSHTALRIITQNSLEKTLEIYKNKKNEKLYNLCTNASKRTGGDFLQRTLMAAFLLRCLQKSGYFEKNCDAVVPTEQQYQIGELLLTNLQILQFNAHEIYETLFSKDNRLVGTKLSYIGVAIYPTVALFNHECYPAVTRHFVGKHIVINAIRPLQADDVIAENYGAVFTCRKLIERQRSLSARYWFNCRCRACLENWPTLSEISSIKRVRCPNKNCQHLFSLPLSKNSLECPLCKEEVSLAENVNALKECEEMYEQGLNYTKEGEREKAIEVLCSALDTFHRVSAPPHKGTHLAQDAVRKCFADDGNVFECAKNTK